MNGKICERRKNIAYASFDDVNDHNYRCEFIRCTFNYLSVAINDYVRVTFNDLSVALNDYVEIIILQIKEIIEQGV
jgi:hypothetical protein